MSSSAAVDGTGAAGMPGTAQRRPRGPQAQLPPRAHRALVSGYSPVPQEGGHRLWVLQALQRKQVT